MPIHPSIVPAQVLYNTYMHTTTTRQIVVLFQGASFHVFVFTGSCRGIEYPSATDIVLLCRFI